MAWATTSRHVRGYGNKWDKLRKRIMERDGFICQSCKAKGKITLARHVDHIKPKAHGGTDDPANLQALCKPCHDTKTMADNGRRMVRETGLDGWPVE